MTINRIKLFAIIFLAAPLLAVTAFNITPTRVRATTSDDPPVTYKAKCAMCHTAKAEKNFDPAKTDEELVQVILKGKKGEKPPPMPGYEAKGMTAEEAKALVTYMKTLRAPAN
jgi:mono/diheme cytochrome c family protein